MTKPRKTLFDRVIEALEMCVINAPAEDRDELLDTMNNMEELRSHTLRMLRRAPAFNRLWVSLKAAAELDY